MNFCGSDDGDGCGRSFPQKSSHGLCAKCTRLATFPANSLEYEQFKVCFLHIPYLILLITRSLFFQSYKQCESCGVAWKNLDSPICARCSGNMPAPALPRPFTPEPARTLRITALCLLS
jgi:hypothetical protein